MIDEILKRAKHRVLVQALTEAACFATAVFALSCALVLLTGTGVLALWIPVAVTCAALGLALFRAFHRRPTLLDAALTIDQRCHLQDALSTELHFRGSALETAQAQRTQAEAAARTVNVAQTLPYHRPRWLYPLACFLTLALFLFFWRFRVERQLDLTAPLLAIHQDPLSLTAQADQAAKLKKAEKDSDVLSRLGTSTPDDPTEQNLPNPPGSAIDQTGNALNPNAPPANVASGKTQDGDPSQPEPNEQNAAGSPKPGADQPPSSRDGAPQSAQAGTKGQGSPEGAGLLSKLKDAMSGLMSKMKPQQASDKPPTGGKPSAQPANNSKDGQKSSDGQAQAGEEDQSAESKPGDGKGKGNTDQSAAAKPGSGMGHSDGSKELKDAEQLAAMGKLSEIIGKRSANVTGEMTIESQSGPQQLKTAYARSNAKHAAASGDVARDEIPIELQSYVQNYFDQVHKQAARKAAH